MTGQFLRYCFILGVLTVGFRADSEFKEEDGVIVLSKADFQKAVDSIEHLLVEFCK